MMKIIEENITAAYLQIVKTILENGNVITDEREDTTIEVLNIITTINKPIPETPIPLPIHQTITPPKNSFWDNNRLQVYCEEFIDKDKKDFIYTYGNRLRDYFQVDQINNAIQRLQNNKHSRRATSITWDPIVDDYETDVPCLILVDFKIRGNILYTTAVWRSHDIYGAWFANLVGLTFLAQYVAKNLDVTVGPITVQSISAHINEHDKKSAIQLLKDNNI